MHEFVIIFTSLHLQNNTFDRERHVESFCVTQKLLYAI